MRPDRALIRGWCAAFGLALWLPALGLPGLGLPLQPADGLALLAWPLALLQIPRLTPLGAAILGTSALSMALSLAMAGGQPLVLGHGLVLVLPVLILLQGALREPGPRSALVTGLLIGAALSGLLFLAQIALGAERLDLRSNLAFSLPPQYGRAFALMPEVSTFAAHAIVALAMALAIRAHPATSAPARARAGALALLMAVCLLLSRSTGVLILAPPLCLAALAMARPLTPARLLHLALALGLGAVLLALFMTQFYADRLASSAAPRSAAMRLASILAGLSPFWRGEVFGVGLGENHEITRRAHDIARALDLRFGQLPDGVNSQVIGRLFEEGWPALLSFGLAAAALLRCLGLRPADPARAALVLLALGSALGALLVTGYRGIYTGWLWLALPPALLAAYTPVRRSTTPTVRHSSHRSSHSDARRA